MNKKTLTALGAGVFTALIIVFALWGFMGSSTEPGNPHIARAAEGVKLVVCCTESGDPQWTGSAVVINDEGYLVTNAHIVCDQSSNGIPTKIGPGKLLYVCYEKQLKNRREIVAQQAVIEGVDPSKDLAWIRIEPDRECLKPVALGETPVSGQFITALGFPGKYDRQRAGFKELWTTFIFKHIKDSSKYLKKKVSIPWSVELGDYLKVVTVGGQVSVVKNADNMATGQGMDATSRLITHTATTRSGMSGGPVIDGKGRVVGITFGGGYDTVEGAGGEAIGKTEARDLNRAVDVQELKHLLATKEAAQADFYITGDPDSLMRRLRAYISVARPYEIALAALGIVLFVGTGVTMIILLARRKKYRGATPSRPGISRVIPMPASHPNGMVSPGNNPMDMDKTVPFNAPSGAEEPEKPTLAFGETAGMRLILQGKDPDGNALRFAVTEGELRRKHSLLLGSKRSSCDIYLPFPYISRQQARLLYREDAGGNGMLFLKDENATNTTKLNEVTVKTECPLYPGDRITVGPVTLTLSVE